MTLALPKENAIELTTLAYSIARCEALHPQAAALLQEARRTVEEAHGLYRHRQVGLPWQLCGAPWRRALGRPTPWFAPSA